MSTEKRQANYERVEGIVRRVLDRIMKRQETPEFPFGIPTLDEVTRGVQRGKLSVIAARTSEGKTSLAMQLASHLASMQKTVAFVSLEDDRETLVEKLYCQAFEIENWRLQRGEAALVNIPEFDKHFKNMKLLVLDDFGYTIEELTEVVSTIDPKPEVLILDYVQLIEQNKFESEFDAISNFVKGVQRFAKEQNIAMVLISQINRTGAKDRCPSLHTLARCGRLEECADLVLTLYAPWVYDDCTYDYDGETEGMEDAPRNYIELKVAKNKIGKRDVVIPLHYTGEHYRFREWTNKDTEDAKYGLDIDRTF